MMKRIHSVDFVRGLVMIIMALDHTRDFMHISSIGQNPTDLSTTTPLLFFTRWITHLCAPTFVFLAGTSAFLSFKKGMNAAKSRNFLLSRGIWLIILEFTLVNFALQFDWHFSILLFEVIGAIGFGFLMLALLLKLPPRLIGLIGLVIIFGHNSLQYIPLADHPTLKTIISSLFSLNVVPISQHTTLIIAYAPIPWLGIMLTGFAAGQLFELEEKRRKMTFLLIGLVALILFIALRIWNVYGDQPWSVQKNNLFSFLSFINVSKYPPSLLFSLITLGIMFLILFWAEGIHNKFGRIVAVFGKVPLFYFLIHLYILHLLMLLMVFLQGFNRTDMDFKAMNLGRPPGSGISLGPIYLIWLSVVAALYPLCKWYANYKAIHKEKKWLRYL